MTWRGSSVTVGDRLLSLLPYILPMLDGLRFADSLFDQVPALRLIYLPLLPFMQLYFAPFVSFVVFLCLFLLVVRNENIAHFIRYNAMQAIMIGIVLSLCGLMFQYIVGPLFGSLSDGFIIQTLSTTVFLGMLASVGFSIVQTLRGLYAEIPSLSEIVHMQIR
jgi:small-conductance mechanosensitive channel